MNIRTVIYRHHAGHIGVGIRMQREAQGLTQKELARRVGVKRNCIAYHERGVSNGIDATLIEQICVALETTPEQLWVLAQTIIERRGRGRPRKKPTAAPFPT